MRQPTQRLALPQPAVLSELHLVQAVPVVLNMSGIEQPIRAYLSANPPAAELMYKEVLAHAFQLALLAPWREGSSGCSASSSFRRHCQSP